MGEKVFENKYIYFRVFITRVIGVLLFVSFIFFTSNMAFDKSDGIKLNWDTLLIVMGIAFAVGIALGIKAVLDIPRMTITVNRKSVHVVRGKAEGFYKLEDFRGYQTTRRQKKDIGTLIFEDEDDSDDEFLLIDCDGFPFGEFKRISDCITVYKHNVFNEGSDATADTLEDDHYAGSGKEDMDPKKFRRLCIIGIIVALAANVGIACYNINKYGFSGSSKILSFQGIILLFTFAFVFKLLRSPTLSQVKDLYISPSELKINDRSWTLKQIESIYITQPYLTSKEESFRYINIVEKDTGKKGFYSIENRPSEYDPQDKYIRLYNSIIDLCKNNRIKIEEFEA